jgi:hypothetical protein
MINGQRRNAPELGQDTDAVLREVGLTEAQIGALRQAGHFWVNLCYSIDSCSRPWNKGQWHIWLYAMPNLESCGV